MRTMLAQLFCVALLLTGCSSLSYDHRGKIATAALYQPNGALDDKAFSGALMEKISGANSPPAALAAFVESLGGKCSLGLTDRLSCSIPQSGGFCVSSRIEITAEVASGTVTSIRTRARNDGC